MNGSSRDSIGQGKPFQCLLAIFLYAAGDNGDKWRITNPLFFTEVPLLDVCFPSFTFSKILKNGVFFKLLLPFNPSLIFGYK